jgi:hypothetical protein
LNVSAIYGAFDREFLVSLTLNFEFGFGSIAFES